MTEDKDNSVSGGELGNSQGNGHASSSSPPPTRSTPSRMELRQLKPGSDISAVFVLQALESRSTRYGKSYLALTLGDAVGTLDGRIWDPQPNQLALTPGQPVRIGGLIEHYRGQIQLTIRKVEAVEPSAVPWVDLLPASRFALDDLLGRLRELLGTLTNPHLIALRDRYLADTEFMKRFGHVPAAARYHHAWIHGLLEHTVSALELAHKICSHYPTLNRDLVLMAVLLHDSGKAWELTESATGTFVYTPAGHLVGHITLGVCYLERHLAQLPDFPRQLAAELRHCILAHHGRLEFGSPKEPMSAEALVVHHVECLDSELATLEQEGEASVNTDSVAGESASAFVYSSRFQRTMLVKRPPTPNQTNKEMG